MERMVVAKAEEDEEVVVGLVRTDVVDQTRAGRSFRIEPRDLVADRVLLREHLLGPLRELDGIAFASVLEAMHGNPVHHLLTLGEVVLPPDVILMRARGQHFDLNVVRQVLGNIPRMLLGAAVDVGAVALNDDRDFHCRSSSEEPAGGSGTLFSSSVDGASSSSPEPSSAESRRSSPDG